jgi:hypothetical protein
MAGKIFLIDQSINKKHAISCRGFAMDQRKPGKAG